MRARTYLILVLIVAGVPSRALASAAVPESGPARDGPRLVAFPQGDVFWPLVADPKAEGTFASYISNRTDPAFGNDVGAVGIGDRLGLLRVNGPVPGEGLQVSVTGTIYSQFRLGTRPMELINSDFQLGLPVTFRRGGLSTRVRLYHQSSHLGDGSLLDRKVPRQDVAFQAVEGLLSTDLGPLRVYGGGEYHMSGGRLELDTRLLHGGLEFRQRRGLLPRGRWSSAHLVTALDVKTIQKLDWATAWSGRAGLEIGSSAIGPDRSRVWSLLAELYSGPLPYGQFDSVKVTYLGLGLHLGM